MQDPKNRELMARLYRWFETRENPPKLTDDDELKNYFMSAWLELDGIIQDHPGPWAMKMAIGFYDGLEEAFKAAQKGEGPC